MVRETPGLDADIRAQKQAPHIPHRADAGTTGADRKGANGARLAQPKTLLRELTKKARHTWDAGLITDFSLWSAVGLMPT